MEIKIVHKSTYEHDASARLIQEIFRGERIGKRTQIEALTLVADREGKAVFGPFGIQMNLFMFAVAVPMHYRVYHAFAHCHANLLLVVFIEPESCGPRPWQ